MVTGAQSNKMLNWRSNQTSNSSFGSMKIEMLMKDNLESLHMQMKTLLIKNDAWIYVSGSKPKPTIAENNAKSKNDFDKQIEMDEKPKQILSCMYQYLN